MTDPHELGGHGRDHDELAADLSAWRRPATGTRTGSAAGDSDGWLARPAVLRRAARLLAEQIPAEVDQIVCAGTDALVLGAAVGLHTGLPYCHVVARVPRLGSVRAGDVVAVVAVTADEASAGHDWAASRGARVATTLAVFGAADRAGVRYLVPAGPAIGGAAATGPDPTHEGDPQFVEDAARALVAELAVTPDVVVSWGDGASQVLAHAVARQLAVARAVVDLDLGVLDLSPLPAATGTALLVAAEVDDTFVRHLPAVRTLLAAQELGLGAVAALRGTSPAADLPTIVLTSGGRAA